VTQLVLPLHEDAAEPLEATVADSATIEPAADPVATGAASTKTSCLCVQV
jgi:hypothetical protein